MVEGLGSPELSPRLDVADRIEGTLDDAGLTDELLDTRSGWLSIWNGHPKQDRHILEDPERQSEYGQAPRGAEPVPQSEQQETGEQLSRKLSQDVFDRSHGTPTPHGSYQSVGESGRPGDYRRFP